MSGYKSNAAADREAIFGPSKSGAGGPKHKREHAANRDALFGPSGGSSMGSTTKSKSPSAATVSAKHKPTTTTTATNNTAMGYNPAKKSPLSSGTIEGPAKVAKLKDAAKFRDAAVQAMQKGIFTRPDPLTAANLYNRAAELYGQCGERRLERLHRIAAADCQMGSGSFPVAAADYTKAAELSRTSDETLERKRKEGNKLWRDAATAWTNAGEPSKAANARVQAALAMVWEDDTTYMDKMSLTAMEEAVEAHVPDVLNPFAKNRATGKSLYAENIHATPTPETMELAREHVIRTPYAHEPVQQLVSILVKYGEFPSALYATGAASYILENDGASTLTLSRSFIKETILQLAMGDPVAAEQSFLNRHVQHDHYLLSRECKLAEELYRSVLNRDEIALDEARSPTGSNRSAMAQLDPPLRELIHQLRISGMARRVAGETRSKVPIKALLIVDDSNEEVEWAETDTSIPKAAQGTNIIADESEYYDPGKMQAEMDDLMAGLDDLNDLGGANAEDDNGAGLGQVDDDDDDDDDIDLR